MSVYKGFSSYQFQENKQFVQTDLELVKTDLIAHIFTAKGSRVMMPDFGTLIPEILFEPLDDITTEMLEDELRTVFDFDPRVQLTAFDMDVNADESAVTVSARLFYIELNRDDTLDLNLQFEQ